jgi:hypothetical protein
MYIIIILPTYLSISVGSRALFPSTQSIFSSFRWVKQRKGKWPVKMRSHNSWLCRKKFFLLYKFTDLHVDLTLIRLLKHTFFSCTPAEGRTVKMVLNIMKAKWFSLPWTSLKQWFDITDRRVIGQANPFVGWLCAVLNNLIHHDQGIEPLPYLWK